MASNTKFVYLDLSLLNIHKIKETIFCSLTIWTLTAEEERMLTFKTQLIEKSLIDINTIRGLSEK